MNFLSEKPPRDRELLGENQAEPEPEAASVCRA